MPVFIVGVQSNIFGWLPEAELISTDNQLISKDNPRSGCGYVLDLVSRIRERCLDFGPTWDSPDEQAIKAHGTCTYRDGDKVQCTRPMKLGLDRKPRHKDDWCEEHSE
jgi:hypothetical protein